VCVDTVVTGSLASTVCVCVCVFGGGGEKRVRAHSRISLKVCSRLVVLGDVDGCVEREGCGALMAWASRVCRGEPQPWPLPQATDTDDVFHTNVGRGDRAQA
jgi:hypothetical protein